MKNILRILAMAACCLLAAPPAPAKDMRAAGVDENRVKEALLEKLEADRRAAEQEAAALRERILADREALLKAVQNLENQTVRLGMENESARQEMMQLEERDKALTEEIARGDAMVRELAGFVRTQARDLSAMTAQSPLTALHPDRDAFLGELQNESAFPAMADIRKMTDLVMEEIRFGGEVRLTQTAIIDKSGNLRTGDVLLLGPFTAAFQANGETGFLEYLEEGRRFKALAKSPRRGIQKALERYMAGQADAVPIDVSRGGALRQLALQRNLAEQVQNGGPIVWPILAILAAGVLIILERTVFLLRNRSDGERLMEDLTGLAACNNWDDCRNACERMKARPVPRVLLSGIDCRDLSRAEMENALQESILKEIPRLERFLSTLGMLAAIAPLLGLLGTVTGMINTFQAITLFGTSDPRMLSGGISEALVTTMLGLAVAIPILFCHTLISRQVENLIAQMEEKAVAFVNMVFKTRYADGA